MLPPLMVFVKSEHPIAVLFQALLPSFSLKVLPRFPPSPLKVTFQNRTQTLISILKGYSIGMASDLLLPYMKM